MTNMEEKYVWQIEDISIYFSLGSFEAEIAKAEGKK